jgi:glycosyltransferase involved in cell wall biosynthesis
MKILHLIFAMQTGGAETMLVDIVNEQVKNNDLTIIVLNNQINKNLLATIDKKVKIILLRRNEQSRNLWYVLKLNWFLLINKPLITHCHNNAAIRIILFRRKTLLTVHGLNVDTSYLNKYSKVFAISEAVKTDIEKRCSVKPIVIYNGINLSQILQKKNYEFSEFKIVQVGRLNHEIKGQHILIHALKILLERDHLNMTLDFIGEGTSELYLKQLVKELNIEDKVNFLGIQDKSYINNHLHKYNLLVQPSLFEGFGLTIVEGMAAKIPVLVSNINGPLEIIEHGKYGWIFDSDNAFDCAEKILNIMHNYNSVIFHKKLESAFSFSIKSFSIAKTARNYLLQYL